MQRILGLLIVVLLLMWPEAAQGQVTCSFQLGFKALVEQIPDAIGVCLENEHFNQANGNAEQRTTAWHGKGGLLVWRKADNWTAYTDGAATWVNGPLGVQQRPNSERFTWEAGAPTQSPPTSGGVTSRPWSEAAPALNAALEDIWSWERGRELLNDASTIGVRFSAEPVVSTTGATTFGYFDLRSKEIHINTVEMRGSNDWAVAGVLVYELRHASDLAKGLLRRDTASNCYSAELRAFLEKISWYRFAEPQLAHTTGPIVAHLWVTIYLTH